MAVRYATGRRARRRPPSHVRGARRGTDQLRRRAARPLDPTRLPPSRRRGHREVDAPGRVPFSCSRGRPPGRAPRRPGGRSVPGRNPGRPRPGAAERLRAARGAARARAAGRPLRAADAGRPVDPPAAAAGSPRRRADRARRTACAGPGLATAPGLAGSRDGAAAGLPHRSRERRVPDPMRRPAPPAPDAGARSPAAIPWHSPCWPTPPPTVRYRRSSPTRPTLSPRSSRGSSARCPVEAHAMGLATCAVAWSTTEDLLADTVGDAAPEVWDWLARQPYVARGPRGSDPARPGARRAHRGTGAAVSRTLPAAAPESSTTGSSRRSGRAAGRTANTRRSSCCSCTGTAL